MKELLFGIGFALASFCAFSGEQYPELPRRITTESDAQREARMAWWRHDRFGMFIHFGLYSLAARHEWVQSREYITSEAYEAKYFRRFNPRLADVRDWVRRAKSAGMKYVVLTTKHHEGFCLWDTKTTDYKITKTPFGRDLVREFSGACRAEGLKVGFYFSVIDWHHPHFTIDQTHPLRPREGFTAESYAKLNEGRDMEKYRKYMFEQATELMTNYGKIDIVWFDYTSKGEYGKTYKDWDAVELVRLTRRLQPQAIIDNRLDLLDSDDGWDFVTPEQFKVATWPKVREREVPWETCQTFSGSWGYHRDETTWKSPHQLIALLSETVSRGGNLIMNVGPTARGEFDLRAKDRLAVFEDWMLRNGESIYGCTRAPEKFVAPNGTSLTYNPESRRLYIHLYEYPMGRLPVPFVNDVEYAQFLHDGSEILVDVPPASPYGDGRPDGGLLLPVQKPSVEVPVVEVFLK